MMEGTKSLFRHCYLLYALVKRDVIGRYKGSIFGVIWSAVEPIVLLVIYTVVFGGIFKLRLEADSSLTSFSLYVFCGIVIWLAISESLNRATTVIIENVSLVKKVIFPTEVLPLKVIFSALVHQLIGLAVLLLGLLFLGKPLAATWLLIPLMLIPQILLTAGAAWILAAVTVFIRDFRQVVSLGTLCGMFLTPVFYPEKFISRAFGGKIAFWLVINPASSLIHNYRNILLNGKLPDPTMYFYTLLLGAFLFLLGFFWFNRVKRAFVDVI